MLLILLVQHVSANLPTHNLVEALGKIGLLCFCCEGLDEHLAPVDYRPAVRGAACLVAGLMLPQAWTPA
jgi:hypothetical protein